MEKSKHQLEVELTDANIALNKLKFTTAILQRKIDKYEKEAKFWKIKSNKLEFENFKLKFKNRIGILKEDVAEIIRIEYEKEYKQSVPFLYYKTISRKRHTIAYPKHILGYWLHKLDMGKDKVIADFCCLERSTVTHNRTSFMNLLDVDEKLQKLMNTIEKKILNYEK